MKKLSPLDLYDVGALLTDEETMVRDTVARFVDSQVLPIIGECFEQSRFPDELIPQIAELGLLVEESRHAGDGWLIPERLLDRAGDETRVVP